jgi:hypothetical protein
MYNGCSIDIKHKPSEIHIFEEWMKVIYWLSQVQNAYFRLVVEIKYYLEILGSKGISKELALFFNSTWIL